MTPNVTEIVLPSRADAEAVLDALHKLMQQYKRVSMSDYLDLVGLSSTFTETKVGWIELGNPRIIQLRSGYIIALPVPKPFVMPVVGASMEKIHPNAVPLMSFSTGKQKGWRLENDKVSFMAVEEEDGSIYMQVRWGNEPMEFHPFKNWAEARTYIEENEK